MKHTGVKPYRLRFRDLLGHASAAYIVLLGMLLLTGLAWYGIKQNVEARERARFEETVKTTEEAIDRRINTYVDAMLDSRGLFVASETIERHEWRNYVAGSDLERRYPGIQAVGYAERVRPEERNDHVARVREEGLASYELRPTGERYEYFPLVYLEPSDASNQRMLGYDVYSDRVNRAAMEQARDTGLPRASGKVDLAEAGLDRGDVFLIYTPIYRKGEPLETLPERRQALQGFIIGMFRADELLEGIFGGKIDPTVDFEVFDGAEYTPERLLHDDDDSLHAGDASYRPSFSDITTLEVAGRYWSLYFSTLPGSEEDWESSLPLFVLLSGLAASLLLFGITFMLVKSRLAAENASKNLEATNRELEATNKELEAFSYSVSHDLRAPLRSIDGFSQILLEDYSDELDEEGKDYLGRVRGASQTMGRLIDDLLGLSRVTRGQMQRKRIDLSALAKEVAQSLKESLKEAEPSNQEEEKEEEEERKVEFFIEEGLKGWGDRRLIRVALENLLGNAIKFTQKEKEARIEFGVDQALSRQGGVEVYYVKDNGAGFEMAYADKLFGAFQRLHGSSEFEGTGIGLATVQRIVHRHGGRIWAKGEVGQGATFFFTLGPGGQA